MIKIVSDGTALGTRVYDEDGKRMNGVESIVIFPIADRNQLVSAQITFCQVELEILAETRSCK